METAWVVAYDSGKPGPVVSFNVEMDALPNPGHACGHNLIATASLAAGLPTAFLMCRHALPGKVLLFGTPGEEGYVGGKTLLLARGAYAGVALSLIAHPGTQRNNPLIRTAAFARLRVEYTGRAAHAAKEPWRGINALDALVLGYNAVAALRQQTTPGDVISLAITDGGGDAANVIHAHAACACVLRARTAARLEALLEKVAACFRAGGEATGARVEIEVTRGYKDHVPNRVLAASYVRCWNGLGDEPPDPPIPPACGGEGQAEWVMSGDGSGEWGQPHSPDFEKGAGTRRAFRRALRVGKALAGVAVDVLTREGLLEEVRREWRRDMDRVRDAIP